MSDEPQRRASHPIRLAFRMLTGAFFGVVIGVITTAVGNGSAWGRYAPFVDEISGATIGLGVDLFTRIFTRTGYDRVKRELVLVGFIIGGVAILWIATL